LICAKLQRLVAITRSARVWK